MSLTNDYEVILVTIGGGLVIGTAILLGESLLDFLSLKGCNFFSMTSESGWIKSGDLRSDISVSSLL